jgi:hypothetical protein
LFYIITRHDFNFRNLSADGWKHLNHIIAVKSTFPVRVSVFITRELVPIVKFQLFLE